MPTPSIMYRCDLVKEVYPGCLVRSSRPAKTKQFHPNTIFPLDLPLREQRRKKKKKKNKRKKERLEQGKKSVSNPTGPSSSRRRHLSTLGTKPSIIDRHIVCICTSTCPSTRPLRSVSPFYFQRRNVYPSVGTTTDAGFEGTGAVVLGERTWWCSKSKGVGTLSAGAISIFIQHLHGASPSVSVRHLSLPSTTITTE